MASKFRKKWNLWKF